VTTTKETVEKQVTDNTAEALTDDDWPSVNNTTIIYSDRGNIAQSTLQCNKCDH